jgi:hypothetical protein
MNLHPFRRTSAVDCTFRWRRHRRPPAGILFFFFFFTQIFFKHLFIIFKHRLNRTDTKPYKTETLFQNLFQNFLYRSGIAQ